MSLLTVRRDALLSRAGMWLDRLAFVALVWVYAVVLGAIVGGLASLLGAPTPVLLVIVIGAWLGGYSLAVKTVAWWRRRTGPAGV